LRAERSAAGLTADWWVSAEREAWRYYLGPCWKERKRIFYLESKIEDQLAAARNAALKTERKREIEKFSTGLLRRTAQPGSDRTLGAASMMHVRRAAANMISHELAPCGYSRSRKLSTTTWLMFIHPIRSGWHLRYGFAIGHSEIEPHLYFCSESLGKKPSSTLGRLYDPEKHFQIQIARSSPEFEYAYKHFETPNELEVILKAHIMLYKLEHEFIISMCRDVTELS
jgi:hypothetical protein